LVLQEKKNFSNIKNTLLFICQKIELNY